MAPGQQEARHREEGVCTTAHNAPWDRDLCHPTLQHFCLWLPGRAWGGASGGRGSGAEEVGNTRDPACCPSSPSPLLLDPLGHPLRKPSRPWASPRSQDHPCHPASVLGCPPSHPKPRPGTRATETWLGVLPRSVNGHWGVTPQTRPQLSPQLAPGS